MTRATTVSADTKKRFVTIVVLSVTIIAIGVGAFFVFRAIKAERAANATPDYKALCQAEGEPAPNAGITYNCAKALEQ